MSDAGYGVYVRIQNTDGALFSSNREELAQVLDDLEALGGGEFKEAIVKSLTNGKVQVSAQVVQLPVAVNSEPVDEAAALAAAEQMLTAPQDEQPQQQFERCNVPGCGGIKDQWKAGGVSQSGKRYSGFWGCNNFRAHPKR